MVPCLFPAAHGGQKEPMHGEEEREREWSCCGIGMARLCKMERKSCVKGIGIKQGLGEVGKERNKQRIPISSQMPGLSKSLYPWVCLYLPRIIQNPTDDLQTLYPPRVPKSTYSHLSSHLRNAWATSQTFSMTPISPQTPLPLPQQ